MKRILLTSLRSHFGRLMATGTAVVLSVAFVVTTLLLTSTYTQTMAAALTAQMARADVQVAISEDAQPGDINARIESTVEEIRRSPHVEAADVQQSTYVQVRHSDRRANANIEPLLSDPLRWQTLVDGSWPSLQGEGTIDEANARTLDVAIGDTLTISGGDEPARATELRIVGITSTANVGFARGTPSVIVTHDTLRSIGGPIASTGILVSGADGITADDLAGQLQDEIGTDGVLIVLTRAEAVEWQVAQLSGSSALLTSLLLVFGVVSLLVAGFVIANTFRVLVAQRTQELALLRCVGASQSQVYWLILLEAGLVGIVFSTVGAVFGIGGASFLAVLSRTGTSSLALNSVTVSPALVVGSILAGTAVTMLFALGPARNATRVRPVTAMRPVEAAADGRLSSASVFVGALLCGIGGSGMAYGANSGAIPIALVAGVTAAVGVLVLGTALLPSAIHIVGQGIAWASAPAQLAVANANRNRMRTAATGTALLVGTILLAMLTTGITSTRDSVMAQIDDRRPFDLIVRTTDGQAISNDLGIAIRETEGVAATAVIETGTVVLTTSDGSELNVIAEGVDPSATQSIAHSEVNLPTEGTVQVNPTEGLKLSDGEKILARGSAGESTLTVTINSDLPTGGVIMTSADLARVSSDISVTQLRLRLSPDLSAEEVQRVTTDILSLSERLDVYGGAPERSYYNQMLDTMLVVVLALLAVAVIIAFVGIGNTAALSVIERRRESALLRAVGLARGQLVSMICIEAALTAAVAASVGLIVGVLFGWAGITALGNSASRVEMALHVPWAQLVLILLGATLAGIIAAALPAYTASKRKPVNDLAAP